MDTVSSAQSNEYKLHDNFSPRPLKLSSYKKANEMINNRVIDLNDLQKIF